MKKRLLGLALALVMVISLLPLTAFAATTPRPAFVFYDPNINPSGSEHKIVQLVASGETFYVTFEDVSDGSQVIGNKPVVVPQGAAAPTTNYIKFQFIDGVFYITFHEINCRPSASYGTTAFMRFYKNTSSYNNEYDIVLTLEGENTISGGTNARIQFDNQGDVTITGSGSLNFSTALGSNVMMQKKNSGSFLIQNTEINLTDTGSTSRATCLAVNGQITIENSTVNITSDSSTGIVVGASSQTPIANDTTTGVTITKGSNVVINVEKAQPALMTNGPIKIENSSAEIRKGNANTTCFATSLPYLTGNYSSVQVYMNGGNDPSMKDLSTYGVAEGTVLSSDDHKFTAYKAVHECVAINKDDTCLTAENCACGKEITPAKQHIAGTKDDCTKNTPCGNPGCAQPYAQDAAAAHVKGEDDGDCTTPIMCTTPGCTQVVEAGAEKHTVTNRTDCSVAYNCEVCGKQAYAAGEHTPAADDGDCTTAVKCSICGKEAIAAKTHKYTDKNDTTCDNEGCTNTRKVEGTENPKTGDNTALVLMVSLMATAAAAFVCTKKFAR